MTKVSFILVRDKAPVCSLPNNGFLEADSLMFIEGQYRLAIASGK